MNTSRDILKFIIILIFVNAFAGLNAQTNCNKCHLFTIGRSLDPDIIKYELQQDTSGKINKDDPINIYWLRRTENNQAEPLTWIQDNYAYGIEFIDDNNSSSITFNDELYSFHFVSYKERIFHIKKSSDDLYKVYTMSGDEEIEVSRIFIQIDGGTFWFPDITKVELYGKRIATGELIAEYIIP